MKLLAQLVVALITAWPMGIRAVEAFPEVVEFYRMSGQVDYLLRVVVPDIEHYDSFYKKLISSIELTDVSSSFAMEQIKYTTALPLDYAPSRVMQLRSGHDR